MFKAFSKKFIIISDIEADLKIFNGLNCLDCVQMG